MRHTVFLSMLVLLSLSGYGGTPTEVSKTAAEKQLPRLGAKETLEVWGKLPEPRRALYDAAYEVLAGNRTATFADVAASPEFQRLCQANKVLHLGGPMLGAIGRDSAKVWLRTCRPARVEVRLVIDGQEKTYGPVASTALSDLSAIVTVGGLKPGTRYPYRVLVDGTPIVIPDSAAITTAQDERPNTTRIAFGGDPHRWGLGHQKMMDLIRQRSPAAMLLCGDVATQDRKNHLGLHRADYLQRDFYPAWQSFAASVPVYAIWDDHDYLANDLAGVPEGFTKDDQRGVWDVFRTSWSNPSYGFGEGGQGVFFRTRIGCADVIMTDGRYFRTGEKGTFLGEEQLKWLEEQLLACKGPFVILASSTMWSDYVSDGKDSWGVYDPEGRERIFSFIEKNRIPGVLLICGDRHGARGFVIPRPGGHKFHEFEPGSLGGITWGPAAMAPKADGDQLFGYTGGYAFGEFTFDTKPEDPTVTFRLILDDGKVFKEMTLSRSQLTPPAR